MSDDPEFYRNPSHGWTCYHCGETFTVPGLALDHFGSPLSEAGCQIKAGHERNLLHTLREMEDQLARYRAEDSDTDRAMHAMQAEHDRALRREEEIGYARGLRDARMGLFE